MLCRQAGIYVRQHPHDAQLSVEELHDMVCRAFSNRVLHYAVSLRGTRQYWFRQRSRLIAMVDTLGLPTVFFTHSAADLHWPELAHLICPDNPDSRPCRNTALLENPAIADWFFHHHIHKFVEAFYVGVLGATDYWLRFEWQHRGSLHVHGLAWLKVAPDVEAILASHEDGSEEGLVQYVDRIVTKVNPAVQPDGSNIDDAPAPKTGPHICNQPYADVQDFDQDLADLVATCQRRTRCSAAYCMRTRDGKQQCRFGYPKPLQPDTALVTEDDEPLLLTARNDGFVNSYNPVQRHWKCSTVCLDTKSSNTVQSTPSVSSLPDTDGSLYFHLEKVCRTRAPHKQRRRKGLLCTRDRPPVANVPSVPGLCYP